MNYSYHYDLSRTLMNDDLIYQQEKGQQARTIQVAKWLTTSNSIDHSSLLQ